MTEAITIQLTANQQKAISPLIAKASKQRQGILLTMAPDAPNPWRMEIMRCSQSAIKKIRKILASELAA
jgi:hypothetical protein